jgi:hypothetical protein
MVFLQCFFFFRIYAAVGCKWFEPSAERYSLTFVRWLFARGRTASEQRIKYLPPQAKSGAWEQV